MDLQSPEITFEVSAVLKFMVVCDAEANVALLLYIVRKPAGVLNIPP